MFLNFRTSYKHKYGKFELLPNGILRAYDYECKWDLTFCKDKNGKWVAHSQSAGYAKDLQNELNRPRAILSS
jgi:hypothetical protein